MLGEHWVARKLVVDALQHIRHEVPLPTLSMIALFGIGVNDVPPTDHDSAFYDTGRRLSTLEVHLDFLATDVWLGCPSFQGYNGTTFWEQLHSSVVDAVHHSCRAANTRV